MFVRQCLEDFGMRFNISLRIIFMSVVWAILDVLVSLFGLVLAVLLFAFGFVSVFLRQGFHV